MPKFLLLLFLLLPTFCFAGTQEASNFFDVKVIEVIDGDNIYYGFCSSLFPSE